MFKRGVSDATETFRITDSTWPSIRGGEFDLGVLAETCQIKGAGLNLTISSSSYGEFYIWITNINDSSGAVPLNEAIDSCQDFFLDGQAKSGDHLVLEFFGGEDIASIKQTPSPIFLAICRRKLAVRERVSGDDPNISPLDEKNDEDNPLILPRRHTIHSRDVTLKTKTVFLGVILVCLLVVLGTVFYLNPKSSRYERYPTPGSTGPKHQSRILYNNATSWARQNHFDRTKWKVRLDDQALVPAHLYTEDEGHYQKWFQQRYPHLQDIVERHDYLRPSWLGSSQISVPWDEQFHFAHCVLALRRYWIAKETGTHVCGRDIDHAHMKHCLDSLDEKAFPPGPMEDVGKGYRLWWQTKVCYD